MGMVLFGMQEPRVMATRKTAEVVAIEIKSTSRVLKKNVHVMLSISLAFSKPISYFQNHLYRLLAMYFILYLVRLMLRLLKRAPSRPPIAPIPAKMNR